MTGDIDDSVVGKTTVLLVPHIIPVSDSGKYSSHLISSIPYSG